MDVHDLTSWDAEKHELKVHKHLLPECDVLGVSATTANVHWGKQIAAEWPARYKVLGGSHSNYIIKGPHERFKKAEAFKPFDYLFVDEAENSFTHFCDVVDKGIEPRNQLIPPIADMCWFTPSGNLMRNPHLGAPDVTTLEGPAFDLWEGGFSTNAMNVVSSQGTFTMGKEAMAASLYTSRGCPYGCTFCADARTKVRDETIDQIKKQCRQLADMGVTGVRLQDDVFSLRASRCREICDVLYDHGLIARANTRVNLSDPDLFKYMASKKIIELGFGVESGSKRILDKMQKGTTPEKNTIGVKMAMDSGIAAKSFIMLGFPTESKETIQESADWILNTRPTMASLALFQPFPGSRVFNAPDEFGITIPDDSFDRFWQQGLDDDPRALVLDLPTISKPDLMKARKDFAAMLDREIGHRDRTRLDSGGPTGDGTFVPSVEYIPGGVSGAM
jgi:radical SAM superfamily enzyme YgiQ (UPF0313 family)